MKFLPCMPIMAAILLDFTAFYFQGATPFSQLSWQLFVQIFTTTFEV